jgi:hypothetical protein
MKTLSKRARILATPIVMLICLFTMAMAEQRPATAPPINLVAGVGGPVGSSNDWSNYSALNLIAGALIFPATSGTTTTALYVGFTQGTQADVGNMVLYTTKRGSTKITAVTPVKLKGVSNPIISLSSKKVCPVQPVSTANPCIIHLDTLNLTLSTLSDYYFVIYFATSSNNGNVGGANAAYPITSLTGWYLTNDQTRLKVGKSIPSGYTGQHPYFLLYVMSN